MEKAKRLLVPRKPITKRKKGGLLRKLELYLGADSYMFAPLFSPLPPPAYSSTKFTSFAAAPGLKREEPVRERKEEFLNKVEDYLMSDMYMYATFVSPQPISPHLDAPTKFRYTKKVTTEITTQRMMIEDKHEERSKESRPGMGISENQSYSRTAMSLLHEKNRLLGQASPTTSEAKATTSNVLSADMLTNYFSKGMFAFLIISLSTLSVFVCIWQKP